jgi:hypothetical protein
LRGEWQPATAQRLVHGRVGGPAPAIPFVIRRRGAMP